jgi:hypothetical protein
MVAAAWATTAAMGKAIRPPSTVDGPLMVTVTLPWKPPNHEPVNWYVAVRPLAPRGASATGGAVVAVRGDVVGASGRVAHRRDADHGRDRAQSGR